MVEDDIHVGGDVRPPLGGNLHTLNPMSVETLLVDVSGGDEGEARDSHPLMREEVHFKDGLPL